MVRLNRSSVAALYETHRLALANEVKTAANILMNPDRRIVYDPWVKIIDSNIPDRTNGQCASQERWKRDFEGLHWSGWSGRVLKSKTGVT